MAKRNRVVARGLWAWRSGRGLLFDKLELRHMLTADFGFSGSLSQLSVDVRSYDPYSILVRLEPGSPPADAVRSQMSKGAGHHKFLCTNTR